MNVYRRLYENWYKGRYNEDENFRTSVRALQALSFVPANDVIPRFFEIHSQVSSSPALKELYKYFGDTYIGLTWDDVMFPISFWNCYIRFEFGVPRTNNSLKAWHFKLNSSLTGSHPTMHKCILKLNQEQNHWKLQCKNLAAGLQETQQLKYRRINVRLKRVLDTYNTTAESTFDYLKPIFSCLNM